jgi:hypothetical protein
MYFVGNDLRIIVKSLKNLTGRVAGSSKHPVDASVLLLA